MSVSKDTLTKLMKETHPWIDETSDLWNALCEAIIPQLDELFTQVEGLPDWQKSGQPLRRLAESWKIFTSGYESDNNVLDLLAAVYTIHQRRGTIPGIIFDVETLLNSTPTVVYNENLEWYLGVTYPDQEDAVATNPPHAGGSTTYVGDGQGTIRVVTNGSHPEWLHLYLRYNTLCFGINTAVIIRYFAGADTAGNRPINDTHRSAKDVEQLIVEEFVPPRVAVDLQRYIDVPVPLSMLESENLFYWNRIPGVVPSIINNFGKK